MLKTLVRLPPSVMKGFTIMPRLSFFECSIEDCKFAWYRRIPSKDRKKLPPDVELESDKLGYWFKVSSDVTYCPTSEDVAHNLKFMCWASEASKPALTISSPVEVGPQVCPFEKRHEHTKDFIKIPRGIRIVTYNILADMYSDSEHSRTVLFEHCPPYALDIDYRRQLLLKEIVGYHADVICLQEVDKKEYNRTYALFFKLNGDYTGIFDAKANHMGEGEAIFFRNSKFELVDTHKKVLTEIVDPQPPDSIISKDIESLRNAIFANEGLKERFMGKRAIIQTTLLRLRDSPNDHVLVANTHLYSAADADHIRLLQGCVCVKYLEFLKRKYETSLKSHEPNISILFCGDMNSTPGCGLYKLLIEGGISSDLPDWSSNKEERVEGLSIETDLKFSSAYEGIVYTNYTPQFFGCLDYIYYENEKIVCRDVVPPPSHEEVTTTGGLPSDVFPSDHIALIANLELI